MLFFSCCPKKVQDAQKNGGRIISVAKESEVYIYMIFTTQHSFDLMPKTIITKYVLIIFRLFQVNFNISRKDINFLLMNLPKCH